MKTNIKNVWGYLLVVSMAIMAIGGFESCNPEPDESDLYTATGITAADFIKGNSELSSFNSILARVGLDKNLSSYGEYTCFVPTNEAVAMYINDMYNDSLASIEHNGLLSNSLEGLIDPTNPYSDSLCSDIARYHLANGKYSTLDMAPVIPMMLGRSIQTETKTDSLGRITINSTSVVVEPDNEVTNGYVHVVSRVIPRNTRMLPDELDRHDEFKLFTKALKMTGLDKRLIVAKKDVKYPDPTEYDHNDTDGTPLFAPTECRVGFTVFVEPDEVFNRNGIYTVDDLIAKCNEWYGNADTWYQYPKEKGIIISRGDDYTNPFNTLNMFIAYHILYAGMPESQLVYEWTSSNGHWNYVNGGQPYDYYETMLPNTLIKIWQPNGYQKSNASAVKALYINRYQTFNTLTNEVGTMGTMHEVEREGVRINRTIDNRKVPTNITAYNGYIHSIQDILRYDELVPKGVLHERMRFDAMTFLPEFINNEFRFASSTTVSGWNGGGSGARIAFPLNYFDNVRSYTSKNCFRFNVIGAYNAWQSNTFQGWGIYDLAVKMPPLPTNNYEFRIFYTPMSHGGMMQFYMGNSSEMSSMAALDIPLDVRVSIDDPRIGWTKFTDDDDLGIATDAALRNHGYMRGVYCYADHAIGDKGDPVNLTPGVVNDERNMRYTSTGNNSLRKIMGRMQIKQSEEKWFRIKSVISDASDLKWQLDFVEFVPIDVVDNPYFPEDWF